MGDKWETSVKIMRPKTPRVKDKCGRQVEDKCKLMRPKEPRVGDKCGRQVWETSVEDKKCGRQVGHKRKLMRSKTSRVGDTCGKQVGDKCKIMPPKTPRVRDKCGRQVQETSVNSCGPRHPEWETSVGDKGETSVNSPLVSRTCLPYLSPTLGSLVRMYNIIEKFYICLGSTLVSFLFLFFPGSVAFGFWLLAFAFRG